MPTHSASVSAFTFSTDLGESWSRRDPQVGSGRSDWARKGPSRCDVLVRQSHVRVSCRGL